jgi:uncharacterized Tic20 family protein
MFYRLKQALVESYVAAIGLGYLFGHSILHFVNIFASPVAAWVSEKEYSKFGPSSNAPVGFPLQAAGSELVRFILLLVLMIVLLRWCDFHPLL